MAKNNFALIATIVSILCSPPVSAAVAKGKGASDLPGTLSVTPSAGVYIFGGSESLNSTGLFGFKVSYDLPGKSLADSIGIEATVDYFTTSSTNGGGKADGFIYRLDALYPFTPNKKIIPTLAFGVGGIQISRAHSSDADFLFNYGGGIKYFLEDWLALRADLRHLVVYNNINTRNNFEFSVGVNYLFGKEHKKKVPPAPAKPTTATKSLEEITKKPAAKPVTLDRALAQKMGLTGSSTFGGETPPPFTVAAPPPTPEMGPVLPAPPVPKAPAPIMLKPQVPAPALSAPEPSAPAAPAIAAPSTPAPAPAPAPLVTTPGPVQAEPEEPQDTTEVQDDTDLPGILALVEIPPTTAAVTTPQAAKTKVKEQPAAPKVVRAQIIEFDTDSWTIKAKYYQALKEIAALTKASPATRTQIEGHTDATGGERHNVWLSKRRAESVKEFLVKFGAQASRISTSAHGPKQPVAENKSRVGKQKNRRAVTIVTVGRPKGPETGAESK